MRERKLGLGAMEMAGIWREIVRFWREMELKAALAEKKSRVLNRRRHLLLLDSLREFFFFEKVTTIIGLKMTKCEVFKTDNQHI